MIAAIAILGITIVLCCVALGGMVWLCLSRLEVAIAEARETRRMLLHELGRLQPRVVEVPVQVGHISSADYWAGLAATIDNAMIKQYRRAA